MRKKSKNLEIKINAKNFFHYSSISFVWALQYWTYSVRPTWSFNFEIMNFIFKNKYVFLQHLSAQENVRKKLECSD